MSPRLKGDYPKNEVEISYYLKVLLLKNQNIYKTLNLLKKIIINNQ